MTDAGENEQVKVLGNPAHASAMAVLNSPPLAAMVTFKFPVLPGARFIDDGLAPIDRVTSLTFVPEQFKVTLTAPDIWFVILGFPTACT